MKIPKKNALLLFLAVSFFGYTQTNNFSTLTIPENLTTNANSVIRISDLVVEIHSQQSMSIKVKTAVTVLNKQGDQNKYIQVPFDKNTKIKSIRTYIYNSLGEEIKKVKNNEYEDISAVDGSSLYGDSRLLYYRYVPTSYPYTIYSEYELATINTGFVPGWRPISSFFTSIENSTYTLLSNGSLKLRHKEKNFEGFDIEKETSDYKVFYKIKNQVAIKNEPYTPPLRDLTPNVIAGLFKFNLEGIDGEATSWSDFGKWQYDYLKGGNDRIDDSIKNEVIKLVEGVDEPIEKAKIVYKFMQDRTRYISVQVGIGGWMPIPANDVHRLGYGDCKGLSNYTKALLDAVGVESYYTVIWANEKRDMEKDFFSIQGNHIIVNLPTENGDVWLECTSQKVPFGYLGDFTDDRDALVITPKGGVIKHTKVYSAEENLQLTKGAFTIDEVGNIKAELKITSKGTQYNDNLDRNDGLSKKELHDAFKYYFSFINDIKFSKLEVANNRADISYDEEINFEAENYSIKTGQEILVPINAFNRHARTPSRVRSRKLPFEISQSYKDVDEVEINLPTSLAVVYVPESKIIETKYGSYSMEVSKIDEHTYQYKRTIQIEEGVYPKEEYNTYRNFRKTIGRYDNSKIILKTKEL